MNTRQILTAFHELFLAYEVLMLFRKIKENIESSITIPSDFPVLFAHPNVCKIDADKELQSLVLDRDSFFSLFLV